MEPMEPLPIKPLQMFFSYSHEDENYAKELQKHLIYLKRQGYISTFLMGDISAGQDWQTTIHTHLSSADIILLLISADFMASDYCFSKEMRHALEMHRRGRACVIPIILRSTLWKESPIGFLQALPKDGKPISTWTNRDDAYLSVTEEVQKRVRALLHLEEPVDRLPNLSDVPTLQKLSSEGNINFNPPEHQIKVNLSTSTRIDGLENADTKNDSTESRIEEAKIELRKLKRQNTDGYSQKCAYWYKRAEQMRNKEDWEGEKICWDVLQEFIPYRVYAHRRLKILKANQDYKHLYVEARQYYDDGIKDAAKRKLLELWQKAPFYGDPDGLAWHTGLYIPLGGLHRKIWMNLSWGGIVACSAWILALILAGITSTPINQYFFVLSNLLFTLIVIIAIIFIYIIRRWIYLKFAFIDMKIDFMSTPATSTTAQSEANYSQTNPSQNRPKKW